MITDSSSSLHLENSHSEVMYHQKMRCVFKFSAASNSTWMSPARDDYRDLSRREQKISTCLWMYNKTATCKIRIYPTRMCNSPNSCLVVWWSEMLVHFTDLKTFDSDKVYGTVSAACEYPMSRLWSATLIITALSSLCTTKFHSEPFHIIMNAIALQILRIVQYVAWALSQSETRAKKVGM